MEGRSVWSRTFFPVMIVFFIDNFGMAIVYPIFTPFFLNPHLHMLGTDFTYLHRTILLGLLIASYPLCQILGAPILGKISDRMGRKWVFMLTLTGGALGFFLTGLGIHYRLVALLWIGRAMAGLFAANQILCLAAIADISEQGAMRTRNFGWVGMLSGIAFVLAILTGASLSNPELATYFYPEIPFLITSAMLVINLYLIYVFYRETLTGKPHDKFAIVEGIRSVGHALRAKGVRTSYFGYFLFIVCWITTLQFLSTNLIHDYNVTHIGITIAFAGVGLAWALANFVLNPLIAKIWAPHRTFLCSLTLLSIFLFLTLIPHEPLFVFIIHTMLATFCAALCWTNGLATISILGTKSLQGSILGINQSLVSFASIAGPIAGGIIAGIDTEKLYLFTALCGLAGALLLASTSRATQPK